LYLDRPDTSWLTETIVPLAPNAATAPLRLKVPIELEFAIAPFWKRKDHGGDEDRDGRR
jgi:hypothetical protein